MSHYPNAKSSPYLSDLCADVLYYYHSDHIGSSTFLTDALGIPYEFMLYLPFGEAMAQQKVAGWGTPYTFTGKEQDAATGLHYFGARYLDTRLSMWFGVDPLADAPANIGWSPYAYVWNSPLNAIDPDGRHGEWIDNGDGTWTAQAGDNASSLAKDACITYEQANKLIESQFGENRVEDGQEFSNLHPGDVIDLNQNNNSPSSTFEKNLNQLFTYSDASVTFLGGIGLNSKEINRYGNTGDRYRAKLFNTNIKLRGSIGSKLVSGIKVGGPLLSTGSIALSLTSNQPTGYKIADTGSSLYGIFGGLIGALASIGYSFGVKPLVRSVLNPTNEENAYRHHMGVKYCNSRCR